MPRTVACGRSQCELVKVPDADDGLPAGALSGGEAAAACTTRALAMFRTLGETLRPRRWAISFTDAASPRPSSAQRISAVMTVALWAASWAGPSASILEHDPVVPDQGLNDLPLGEIGVTP